MEVHEGGFTSSLIMLRPSRWLGPKPSVLKWPFLGWRRSFGKRGERRSAGACLQTGCRLGQNFLLVFFFSKIKGFSTVRFSPVFGSRSVATQTRSIRDGSRRTRPPRVTTRVRDPANVSQGTLCEPLSVHSFAVSIVFGVLVLFFFSLLEWFYNSLHDKV